ncbi:hypothetical protein PGTUg99_019756 [Puccinia graminis f. sp. tritici]|uniref:Secreted protein n=1 Tax=Puccinia graminis f. sp. tritici TaxID=56615 RepID=A0A5B0R7Q5_PUCGR|nr:hypothetical protein PGTUg99_019756 [Puccinia graminis f. sp. tritici]
MFQMNTVSRANAAVYVVIALAILCVHLSVAHPKHTSGGQQQCVESIIPGPRDNNQILCEVSKDVYYACEKSNCNSGGSPEEDPSVHPFSKMTWQQCALAPGTTRDRKVTGTLTYMVDHKYGIMGVRGTEDGVAGDHYYECSQSANTQRSWLFGLLVGFPNTRLAN